MSRTLGRSGIKVSDIGFGCWAIGGPFTLDGRPDGWGEVDDAQSTAAVASALDQGITFFDTADVYGAGHSERVLGQALAGRREDAVIATTCRPPGRKRWRWPPVNSTTWPASAAARWRWAC